MPEYIVTYESVPPTFSGTYTPTAADLAARDANRAAARTRLTARRTADDALAGTAVTAITETGGEIEPVNRRAILITGPFAVDQIAESLPAIGTVLRSETRGQDVPVYQAGSLSYDVTTSRDETYTETVPVEVTRDVTRTVRVPVEVQVPVTETEIVRVPRVVTITETIIVQGRSSSGSYHHRSCDRNHYRNS